MFNYNIEIITSMEKYNSYILVFDNEEKALKANAQFYLPKYRPRRPGPGNPVFYKVLSPVTVREGKSLKSKKVKVLEKNDIILVNQVKGRRARFISSQGGPGGWVFLLSDRGKPFLEQCEQTNITFDKVNH